MASIGEIHRATHTGKQGNSTALTRGLAVVFNGAENSAIVQTNDGGYVNGFVIYGSTAAGETFTYCSDGDVMARAADGETISQGDAVTVKEAGRLKTAATGDIVVGEALEDTPAAGGFLIIRTPGGPRYVVPA